MRGLLVLIVLGLSATIAGAGDTLFDAITAGDKAAVEQALANGTSVDSRARDQATPLIAAALNNQLAIAELLAQQGRRRYGAQFGRLHTAPRSSLFR